MQRCARPVALAAALGLIPALMVLGVLLLLDGPPSFITAVFYAGIVLGSMVAGVVVLWLIPALLFILLPRLGVLHARVAVFRGISLFAVLLALAPVLALLLLGFRLLNGTCTYPFAPAADRLCHDLWLAGTWGFALSVPAGGFFVLLGLLILRLSAMNESSVTVAERARREGLA